MAPDEAELFETAEHLADDRGGDADHVAKVLLRDAVGTARDGDEHVVARGGEGELLGEGGGEAGAAEEDALEGKEERVHDEAARSRSRAGGGWGRPLPD